MAESFQNEIPKARINITLDLETGGARKKRELPLKLLMIGDFTNGKAVGTVASRERVPIDNHNFDQVIKTLMPEIHCVVPNRIRGDGTELVVNLRFDSIASFRPEALVNQIPELRNLVAMRNLLKDLKSNLIDNRQFRVALEEIFKDRAKRGHLKNELRYIPRLDQSLPIKKRDDK